MPTPPETAAAEQHPLGLRFVVDVLNDTPRTGRALRHLVQVHGGREIVPADFDWNAFRRSVERVYRVFNAVDDAGSSAAINALLAEERAPVELHQLHTGQWVLRPAVPLSSPSRWFAASAAFGLGQWMAERGRASWGVCAADACTRVFIDAGRRNPQQYCSSRCSTRTRVSVHRESARTKNH